jgi:hypothetical protein
MMRPSVNDFYSLIWSSFQPATYSLGRTYLRQVSASVNIPRHLAGMAAPAAQPPDLCAIPPLVSQTPQVRNGRSDVGFGRQCRLGRLTQSDAFDMLRLNPVCCIVQSAPP